jgi:CRISPR-associated endonuclease Csy4
MDHYVDIDLHPDPEINAGHLMSALYAKLHRALVHGGGSDIGVSFPGHDSKVPHLGSKLRLHGGLVALTSLMAGGWLSGMRDHIASAGPKPVPDNASYCAVRRVQAKSNPERLRRRLMRRHGVDAKEAQRRIPDSLAETVGLPYVQLRSASTDQTFRLFIDHRHPSLAAVAPGLGGFNAYGLSQTANVPWF